MITDIPDIYPSIFLVIRLTAFMIFTIVVVYLVKLITSTYVPKAVWTFRIQITVFIGIMALAQLVPILMDIFDLLNPQMSLPLLILYRFSNSLTSLSASIMCLLIVKEAIDSK